MQRVPPSKPDRKTRKDDGYEVPAVDRAVRIMLLLADRTREMGLAEIAAATGWHRSSIHKILMTLSRHGFLERNDATKRYALGSALLRCTRSVLNGLSITHAARPYLRELADYSRETANLAVLRGSSMIIVDVIESPVELRVSPPIGTTDPLTNKSIGKAVLAWLPEDRIAEIIKAEGLPARTRNSITNAKLFRDELAAVRKQGYAADAEEFQEGISAVSAPVFGPEGAAIATLSIIGPAFRMTKEKTRHYGAKCVETAAKLSSAIR